MENQNTGKHFGDAADGADTILLNGDIVF